MPFFKLLPLLAYFLQAFLLILLLRVRRKHLIHQVFGLFLGSMALWGLLIFGLRASPSRNEAIFWERLVLPLFPLIATFFFHFCVLFTERRIAKWTVRAIYFLGFSLAALAPTPLVLQGIQVKSYGYAPDAGPLWFPWIGGIYLSYFFASYLLYSYYRRTSSAEGRNRALYLLAGITFSFLGGTSDYLAAFGLLPHPGGIYGNILFALWTTLAVVRLRLLEIEFIIRRGLAYSAVSVLAILPYVGSLIALQGLFRARPIPLTVNLLIMVLMVISLQPLGRRIQEAVDRWFFRERYDGLKSLRRFSQEASGTLELDKLSSSLLQVLGEAMATRTVHLFLHSPEKGSLSPIASTRADLQPLPSFMDRSPLGLWLKGEEPFFRSIDLGIDPRLQALPWQHRQAVEKLQGELFIPLKSRARLVGLLVLGKKLSGQPYTQEDTALLLTVASQASLAIENARLYVIEREQVAELQRLDQMKSDFLLTAAHQLKTPITAIKASAGMLGELGGNGDKAMEERLTANILRSAQALERETSDLLQFLRVKTAKEELHLEMADIREVILGVVEEILPAIRTKDQSLELFLPPELPSLPLDRRGAVRIVTNLLSNANKFTAPKGRIEVRVLEADSYLVIQVGDNGSGIPVAEQTRVFDAYYQVKDTVARGMGGTGLGLAIAKSLVELHGGKIWLESTPGQGSTFSFSLPLQPEHTPAPVAR